MNTKSKSVRRLIGAQARGGEPMRRRGSASIRITRLMGLTAMAVSCVASTTSSVAHTSTSEQGRRTDVAPVAVGSASSADSLTRLIAALGRLDATYVHPAENTTAWVFSGEQSPTVRAITAFGDTALTPLAECIGDTMQTRTTLAGTPVRLGVLCYEALTRLIYHEETDASGDINPEWPGYVLPDATAADLRRARRAWLTVLRQGTYHRA